MQLSVWAVVAAVVLLGCEEQPDSPCSFDLPGLEFIVGPAGSQGTQNDPTGCIGAERTTLVQSVVE